MAVGKARSGKGARVSAGGTTLRAAEFEAAQQADDLDTTNFECSGTEQGTIGVLSATWSIRGDWDASVNMFDNPPGLYPRDDLLNLYLYTNLVDNVYWYFATARVLSSRNSGQVRGKVTFEASGKNQGTFVSPTGSV